MRPRPFAVACLALACAACGDSGSGSSTARIGTAPTDGSGPGCTPLSADERSDLEAAYAAGQTIYVPAYSHVYTSDEGRPFLLAATLSVRNVDPARPIVVDTVRYYDSAGKVIRE